HHDADHVGAAKRILVLVVDLDPGMAGGNHVGEDGLHGYMGGKIAEDHGADRDQDDHHPAPADAKGRELGRHCIGHEAAPFWRTDDKLRHWPFAYRPMVEPTNNQASPADTTLVCQDKFFGPSWSN